MKKLSGLLLTLIVLLGLAACGSDEGVSTSMVDSPPGTGSQYAVNPADAKIAIICEPVGAEQFLLQVTEAAKESSAKYGFEYSVMECPGDDDFMNNARAAVFEDYTLIIGVGWKSADAISAVAEEYPDKAKYAIIDTLVEDLNVTSIKFLMSEPCYVLGVLEAACFPDEDVYGVVGAFQNQTTYEQRYGYFEGVKSVNPDAKFIQNFVGSYTDPATARELALQQMGQGCKVICAMAATACNEGILSLAKERPGELYTSSQEVDWTTEENPYIMSGMLKNTGVVTHWIIDGYFAGDLPAGHQTLGLSTGAVGVIHVTTESANYRPDYVTDEAIALAKEAAEKIISGELVIEVPQE